MKGSQIDRRWGISFAQSRLCPVGPREESVPGRLAQMTFLI